MRSRNAERVCDERTHHDGAARIIWLSPIIMLSFIAIAVIVVIMVKVADRRSRDGRAAQRSDTDTWSGSMLDSGPSYSDSGSGPSESSDRGEGGSAQDSDTGPADNGSDSFDSGGSDSGGDSSSDSTSVD